MELGKRVSKQYKSQSKVFEDTSIKGAVANKKSAAVHTMPPHDKGTHQHTMEVPMDESAAVQIRLILHSRLHSWCPPSRAVTSTS